MVHQAQNFTQLVWKSTTHVGFAFACGKLGESFFVANYCPLVFMEGERGKNRVPEKLRKAEREPLLATCDASLREVVALLEPEWVIGVGKWPRVRAEKALAGVDVKIGHVLHPSPANPRANKGWAPQAEKELEELGIALP